MSKCTICNQEMKIIPAGVSKKTGKPYNAFEACPNKCPKASYGAPGTPKTAPQTSLNNNPDVYDLLTTLVANTNTILKILNKEMPNEEEY